MSNEHTGTPNKGYEETQEGRSPVTPKDGRTNAPQTREQHTQHRPERPDITTTNTRESQHKAQVTLSRRGRQRRGNKEPYGP